MTNIQLPPRNGLKDAFHNAQTKTFGFCDSLFVLELYAMLETRLEKVEKVFLCWRVSSQGQSLSTRPTSVFGASPLKSKISCQESRCVAEELTVR